MTDDEIGGLVVALRERRWMLKANAAEAEIDRKAATALASLQAEVRRLREGLEAATMARTRLEQYADAANAGRHDAGGRELKRQVWAAFSDFDRLRALKTTPQRNEGEK